MRNLHPTILLTAYAALLAGAEPAAAADFPTVVEEILDNQTDGPLARMAPAKRRAMTSCVVAALEPLASGKKRFVLEGSDFEEREHRFGRVVDENHAEWRQKIARACSQIALKDDSAFTGDGESD